MKVFSSDRSKLSVTVDKSTDKVNWKFSSDSQLGWTVRFLIPAEETLLKNDYSKIQTYSDETANTERIFCIMAFLEKTLAFLLIFWILGRSKLAFGLIDNCNLTQKGKRMLGTVFSTPNVYTSLQCLDYCFRESNCEGFNFKSSVKEKDFAECELIVLNAASRLNTEEGWMYMKPDKAELRKKWVSNDQIDLLQFVSVFRSQLRKRFTCYSKNPQNRTHFIRNLTLIFSRNGAPI